MFTCILVSSRITRSGSWKTDPSFLRGFYHTWPIFVSKKLDPSLREPMIALLKEYFDCFAWNYTEMPGLDRSIIEHRLPLKKGFQLFQQRAHQMRAKVLEEVKKEIEKMLEAGFIRLCRYAEWISSIVPVQKKDGRW
jgi:hypothetical protein